MSSLKDDQKYKNQQIRQKNASLDSILSNVKTKHYPQQSLNSFQGIVQEDQNSTILPESPFLKNQFTSTNTSKNKFLNFICQENSMQNKIDKIKMQLQNNIVRDFGKSIIQERLDSLKQTIQQQQQQMNIQKCCIPNSFNRQNQTQNGLLRNNYFQKDEKIKSFHIKNKSETNYLSILSKSDKDSILINSSTYQFQEKSVRQSKNSQQYQDEVIGDCSEGYQKYLESIYEKKKNEFCEQFYENMYKDAERQFKGTLDKSKPIQQLLEYHCEKTLLLLNEIVEYLTQAISVSKTSTQLDEKIMKCIMISNNLKVSYLMIVLQRLLGKICYLYNDFLKCIKLMKLCKNFSQFFGIQRFKISCYKYIGLGFQRLSKPKVALAYFIKMLRQSWLLKKEDQEINSYDLIGMCYFYLGSIEKAQLYHQMMIDGIKCDEEVKKISNLMLKNRIYSNYPTLLNLRIKKDSNEGQQTNGKLIKRSKIINQQYQLTPAEWNEDISSSEDEFELPQAQIGSKNIAQANFQKKILSIPWNDRFIQAQIHKLELVQDMSYNKNPIGLIFKNSATPIEQSSGPKPQLVIGPQANKIYNQNLQMTYSSRLRVSHKTPNREFFNYHSLVQQIKDSSQINQINQQQYDVMVDSIELTHHLKVVKNIKKVREYLKHLIPFITSKLSELKALNTQLLKDQSFNSKQNSNSPLSVFIPSHMNQHLNSFIIEDKQQSLNSTLIKQKDKDSIINQQQPNERNNIFQTLYQPFSTNQSPEPLSNKQNNKQLLQIILNNKNNNTPYLSTSKSNTKGQYFKTSRQDDLSFSNSIQYLSKQISSPKNSKIFKSLNQSRKNSQQFETLIS